MGTTVAGVHLHPTWGAVTFHAGDSRVYRFRQGILKALTTDHSHAKLARQQGPFGAEATRGTSVVWKCLGSGEAVLDPTVQHAAPGLHPGDRYLLTTDGLTDMVSVDAAEQILASSPATFAAAMALVHAALAAAGRDTVTVILADVAEELITA